MRKNILLALLFCCGLAQAFEAAPKPAFKGALKLTTNSSGVRHTLSLDRWQLDGKGVPAFDYVYEQHTNACHFRLTGRAVASVEQVKGKIELVVYNSQDEQGREMPPVVSYDSRDLALSFPYQGKLRKVVLQTNMQPAPTWARACDKGDDEGLLVVFRK